jgi:hypothetical protein
MFQRHISAPCFSANRRTRVPMKLVAWWRVVAPLKPKYMMSTVVSCSLGGTGALLGCASMLLLILPATTCAGLGIAALIII